MELVSAAKMRKSEETALSARPYAKKALNLLRNIARQESKQKVRSPYFKKKAGSKICLVVVTSDRGLCGAFNSQVLRAALKYINAQQGAKVMDVVAVGKKSRDYFKRAGIQPKASFYDFSEIATLSDIKPLADWLIAKYHDKEYNRIVFCSTSFISALKQKVGISQVLPLTIKSLENIISNIVPKYGKYSEIQNNKKEEEEETAEVYIFEPSSQAVFDELVLDLIKVAILHLIYESNASEHAGRMVAMKNATENAENVVQTLEKQLNKIRQEEITRELIEMSSAKEALSSE